MSYFNKVMNMSINESVASAEYVGTAHAYVIGHRDARHSAADIANEADAQLAAKDAEIERLLWENKKLTATNVALKEDNNKLRVEREEWERQEPVDYVGEDDMGNKIALLSDDTPIGMPLYARPVPAVPEGMMLVPKEPTAEMLGAGEIKFHKMPAGNGTFLSVPYLGTSAYEIYKAMLAAAQQNDDVCFLCGGKKPCPENCDSVDFGFKSAEEVERFVSAVEAAPHNGKEEG